jgi:hypothetical protein
MLQRSCRLNVENLFVRATTIFYTQQDSITGKLLLARTETYPITAIQRLIVVGEAVAQILPQILLKVRSPHSRNML